MANAKKKLYFDNFVSVPETGCAYVFSDIDSPTHKHTDFYEMTLVTYGSFLNEYKGKKQILRQNDLIFFRHGEEHSIFVQEEGSIHFTFIITEAAFRYYVEQFGFEELQEGDGMIIRSLTDVQGEYLAMLARNIRNSQRLRELTPYIRMYVMNCFSWLVLEEVQPVKCLDQYTEDLLHNLNHFRLLNCYIKDIYRRYPVASSALISNFKKQTGYTIVQYVGRKRMEYAAQLLTTKDYSVAAISNMLNLTSVSYFTKKFKEQFGVTPSQFQKQSKNIVYNWSEDIEYGLKKESDWKRFEE